MRMFSACLAGCLVLSAFVSVALGWSWLVLFSSGLTIAVLYTAASASRAHGWQLFWLLAALHGGIGVINIQLEALVFRMFPPLTIAGDTVYGLAQVALVSAILTLGRMGRSQAATRRASRGLNGRLWLRVPAIALAYVVLFFVAGSLALPFVRPYYASSQVLTIPPLMLLLGAEFLRGLVYVAALAPLLRRLESRRRQAALIAGLSLSVLGGIAPLLLPVDSILPPDVRRIHMLEIFGSNFTLGVIAGFLLVRPAPSHSAPALAVPA
ncbi:MAG TPA: hypothetical protein VFL57_06210 [Bryobacteraceae bacterium]|nr:hypothetical protein [Bryobacteraceae bacterium]